MVPPTPGQTLARRIVARSKTLGLPLDLFFRAAHINRSTFSRWREGATSPTTITLARVEKALRASARATLERLAGG